MKLDSELLDVKDGVSAMLVFSALVAPERPGRSVRLASGKV